MAVSYFTDRFMNKDYCNIKFIMWQIQKFFDFEENECYNFSNKNCYASFNINGSCLNGARVINLKNNNHFIISSHRYDVYEFYNNTSISLTRPTKTITKIFSKTLILIKDKENQNWYPCICRTKLLKNKNKCNYKETLELLDEINVIYNDKNISIKKSKSFKDCNYGYYKQTNYHISNLIFKKYNTFFTK